jgi:ABC-type sugar transport system ATPase subunit
MRSEIKELHQRLKTTSIYVTHDQIEAMTMADKIVVMKDGRIEQIGSRWSCTTARPTPSWPASSARRR